MQHFEGNSDNTKHILDRLSEWTARHKSQPHTNNTWWSSKQSHATIKSSDPKTQFSPRPATVYTVHLKQFPAVFGAVYACHSKITSQLPPKFSRLFSFLRWDNNTRNYSRITYVLTPNPPPPPPTHTHTRGVTLMPSCMWMCRPRGASVPDLCRPCNDTYEHMGIHILHNCGNDCRRPVVKATRTSSMKCTHVLSAMSMHSRQAGHAHPWSHWNNRHDTRYMVNEAQLQQLRPCSSI